MGENAVKLMSIAEFAEQRQISYEAARKSVSKYEKKELKGHVIQKNRKRYLDEYAINFLSEHRREQPIVMLAEDKSAEVEALKAENDNLKTRLLEAQNTIVEIQQKLISRDEMIFEMSERLLEMPKPELEQTEAKKKTEAENAAADQSEPEPEQTKKWWQFWR